MRFKSASLFVFFLLTGTAFAGDSILLNDGHTLEGEIMSWTEKEFVIFDGYKAARVQVNEIRQINFKPTVSRF